MFARKSTVPITRDHNKKIVKIIQSLLTADDSVLFRKPVPFKALGFDDYRQYIKKPIDLNLIRRQYNQNKYKTVQQVLDDMQLVWDNCIVYCKLDSEFYVQATKMQKIYHQIVKQLLPQFWQNIQIEDEENRRNNQKKQILRSKQATLISKTKKQQQANIQVQPLVIQKIQEEKIQKVVEQKKKMIKPTKTQTIVQQQQVNSQIEQENSEQREQQRQPILIKLNQNPSLQQLQELNDWIAQIQQKEDGQTLGKIFQILYKYERQNLISGSTNESMDFKMNEIHLSTYYRMRKYLQQKLDIQPIESESNNVMMNGNHNISKGLCNLIE